MRVPAADLYWIGNDTKQSAIDYARARTKFGRAEIRVLEQDGSAESESGFRVTV